MRDIGDGEMRVLLEALREARAVVEDALSLLGDEVPGEQSHRSHCVTCKHRGVEEGGDAWKEKCLPCRRGDKWERKPWVSP